MNPGSGTTLVVGGSRGLGRGIARAVAAQRGPVVALSRTAPGEQSAGVLTELGDAGDPAVAARLLERHAPDAVVLVAGAAPPMLALPDQTWETFSVSWDADVRIAFHWLQAVLRQPLPPGGRVVVVSSGAALGGSPLSGGYAGAKATQRFLAAYAREESGRAGLGLLVTTLLPKLTPLTDLGRAAVRAYAARAATPESEYSAGLGDPLTPQAAGEAVAGLLRCAATDLADEYVLSAAGLRPLP